MAFGYTLEDLRMILDPMAATGAEPIGSMGNDAPLAVLSDKSHCSSPTSSSSLPRVSNPPLDAIREELVTSTSATIGPEQNLFDETPAHCRQLRLGGPVLTNRQLEQVRNVDKGELKSTTIRALFDPSAPGGLKRAMDLICSQASEAVRQGYPIIILSDRGVDAANAPIPSLLATAGVHHHLIREGTRTKVGLVVESGEPREVAHFALLIGYGAGAVNPYLAFETLDEMSGQSAYQTTYGREKAQQNYIKALDKGILKIMSKMGISTIQSYRGAQIFEAVGLNLEFVDRYFTWTPSRISGIGLEEIEEGVPAPATTRPSSKARRRAAWTWTLGASTNGAATANTTCGILTPSPSSSTQCAPIASRPSSSSQATWTARTQAVTIRGLLKFKRVGEPIPIDEVEPAKEIVKRFATGAISLGAISREAHETLAIATNRISARSNTGEGGEDYRRFTPDPNGDSRESAMKQVASGRFGVTINYLTHARDLQIKMAQGSKPVRVGSFQDTRSTSTSGGSETPRPASSSSRRPLTTTSTPSRTWHNSSTT